jgi:hypothetical protein
MWLINWLMLAAGVKGEYADAGPRWFTSAALLCNPGATADWPVGGEPSLSPTRRQSSLSDDRVVRGCRISDGEWLDPYIALLARFHDRQFAGSTPSLLQDGAAKFWF